MLNVVRTRFNLHPAPMHSSHITYCKMDDLQSNHNSAKLNFWQAKYLQNVDISSLTGTNTFLHANPAFVNNAEKDQEILCNKDTGGMKTLRCWSRGLFFVVSSSGHIDYWQPLYR